MLEPLDVNSENLLLVKDIAQRFKIHPSTLWRWLKYGKKGVYLAVRKVGGHWYTSEEAFQRFCDEVTLVALGDQPEKQNSQTRPECKSSVQSITSRKNRARRIRDAEREFRADGLMGDAAVFRNSTCSKELLCDLHEFIEGWMPGARVNPEGAYAAVRGGIFAYASEILEGKHGKSRSFAAAKAWVESIDVAILDVSKLKGVGPLYEAEWKIMLGDPAFAKLVHKQNSAS